MIVVRLGLIRARIVPKRVEMEVIVVVAMASFVGWRVWDWFFIR